MKYSTSAKLHTRANKEGKRAIYVTYTYNKITTLFPTAFLVGADDWHSISKLAVIGSADAVRINQKIQQMQTDLLAIAASLPAPEHELVKRLFSEQAYKAAKAEFNKHLDLAIAIGEDEQIAQAETKLQQDAKQLAKRKKAFAPVRTQHGLNNEELSAQTAAEQQLAELFAEYAGSGEVLAGKFYADGKPRHDQGTLKHYKRGTYLNMRQMWTLLQEFSKEANYTVTIQSINLHFYQLFGDFILYKKESFDMHFGSVIKRLKSFLFWAESEKGITLNQQVKSKKFKALTETREIHILNDEVYKALEAFKEEPECKQVWKKYIDLTLFQCAMGLRHSDVRRATWYLTGNIENGVDKRIIRGSTKKNKSTYNVPVYLNPEWTINILERYSFDFNKTARSEAYFKTELMVTESRFNKAVKEILEAFNKKHCVFKHKIKRFRHRWGHPHELEAMYQYQMHSSHDNRRAFITRMFRLGYSEKVVANMVGTKSVNELRKYQQVADEDFFK